MGRKHLPLVPAGLIYAGVFVAPLLFFFVISFWSVKSRILRPDFTFKNYIATWVQYWDSMANTMAVALMIAAVTTLLAFGFAYAVRFKAGKLEGPLLFLALITLFGGYLVKIYAWKSILGRDGILNQALVELGLVDQPVDALLYNTNAVIITLTYFLLPFAILPIYGNLRAINPATIEAARDLGAKRWAVMRDVILPQCEKGIVIAFTLAFLISAGDYVTPRFVGGGAAMMGHFIELQFSLGFNWPQGSAMSFSAMLLSLAIVLALRAAFKRELAAMRAQQVSDLAWRGLILLISGFMALPLLLVVLFSFNRSALTSLPLTGLTFDWYRKLFAKDAFWPALENSLMVGFASALLAIVTGTLAALALSRFKPRQAGVLINILSIPMMMPALIIGVSLMSYFVRFLDVPLGLWTVVLGHVVIAQPFVVLILYARLAHFDWSAVDSARDLGASPLQAFFTITLPIIQPTIVGAGLIALSISLDDFVIAFFTIGAGNTLPTLVWGLVRTSLDPTINAIATLLLALSIGSTILALRLSRYRG